MLLEQTARRQGQCRTHPVVSKVRIERIFSGVCVALAGWLVMASLGGVFVYTTQGDRCGGLVHQIRDGRPNIRWNDLNICFERQSSVYHAFVSEIVLACALTIGAGWLWRAKGGERHFKPKRKREH